jgi:hypothetical protein
MTKEEILLMEPGLVLDKLIAEHVMALVPQVDFGKWEEHNWITYGDAKDFDPKDGDDPNEINYFAYDGYNHNGPRCKRCGYSYCCHCHDEIPKDNIECINDPLLYSSNITFAMRVLEKIKSTGSWIKFKWNPKKNYYTCMISGSVDKIVVYTYVAKCKELSEALCKAALIFKLNL